MFKCITLYVRSHSWWSALLVNNTIQPWNTITIILVEMQICSKKVINRWSLCQWKCLCASYPSHSEAFRILHWQLWNFIITSSETRYYNNEFATLCNVPLMDIWGSLHFVGIGSYWEHIFKHQYLSFYITFQPSENPFMWLRSSLHAFLIPSTIKVLNIYFFISLWNC